jgi:3-carboxy-cis,cis-muconate cycloisomerase
VATTLDCDLLGDFFGTPRMRAVFDSRALLQALLDVEAALAEAEAEVGVIPPEAGQRIRAAAAADRFDLDALREQMLLSQHPLVPIVRALGEEAGADAGQYVHWGATTQDVMDTATVLRVGAALDLIEGSLAELVARLAAHAREYARTPMAGRTHGQHALPITFGLKVAVWLDELGRTRERLAECRPRVLVGELAGGAGTLASLRDHAAAVRENFCRRLSLGVPTTPWHVARDGFAELVSILGLLAGTMEKIALEVIRLQATEVGEVAEHATAAHVGSSTMPQKRNPMTCEYVAAACKLVRGLVPTMQAAMVGAHERDMAAWAVEWLLVPQAFIMIDGALTQLSAVVGGLEIDDERMAANLELTRGAILAEAVMLALGRHTGREYAHELMTRVTRDAARRGVHLRVALREHPEVSAILSESELEVLLESTAYLGEASVLAAAAADRVLPAIEASSKKESPSSSS